MKKGQGVAWIIALLAALLLLGYLAVDVISGTFAKDDGNKLKLGLDLAGGVSITYEAVGETPTEEQMQDTITKIKSRIENDLASDTTTTEASVYPVGDDRITVEIPGVTDANAMLEQLGTPGTIYFIAQTDASGNPNYQPNSMTGAYELTKDIDTLIADGSVVIQGSQVTDASATYQKDQTTGNSQPVVSISLNDEGTKSFAEATTKAASAGETIGIYYDGQFVSVPRVNEAITTGQAVINGMTDYEEAEKLASYIRIGGLDIELQELQSEVVGASLGGDALKTSLMAAGIGLLIVMVFMIIVYWGPGVAAALALAIYTGLMIFILWAFDVTLTLPGIAGIILSIGMAVDANAIIFSRIREENASGKSVAASIDIGFKKAMSAIVDGNVTTLIAAAVLGIFGSGTVKGFAITLAIGVLLSMFTALIITRLLIYAFYAVGLRDVKWYGKAKERKTVNFISKRGVFFIASLAVISVGLIGMSMNSAKGNKALNFSLEFMGGTATTVQFDKEYTLEEADEQIVPYVAEITGDNNIQTQVVDGSNQIIFKTRSLELSEREALNETMETNFGVKEENIQSTNIGSSISKEMRSESIVAVLIAVFCMLIYIWFRFKDIRFATSAIIALVHDVLVVLALYAVARISVGSAFIACMLTVVGYSVNDTIVIFDRIRENMKSLRNNSPEEVKELANESVTQTLSRTLSTSFTTVVMVLMLLILGVTSIKEFALPLLVGMTCGTYSSICIATELWYVFKVRFAGKKK
ncbi:MAG: protein translocase subunit SecD [Lachnospiraceae bacterium]|nr:protein translocase subunit SecD [Lachnospiraceae bacterium]